MKISDFSVGNAVTGSDGRLFKLNTTMLGQYQLWETNNQKWQKPFNGILITNESLSQCGFSLATYYKPGEEKDYNGEERDLEFVDHLVGYVNIHVNREGLFIANEGEEWFIVKSEMNADESTQLQPQSRALKYIHELQNSSYWLGWEIPEYDGAL